MYKIIKCGDLRPVIIIIINRYKIIINRTHNIVGELLASRYLATKNIKKTHTNRTQKKGNNNLR